MKKAALVGAAFFIFGLGIFSFFSFCVFFYG